MLRLGVNIDHVATLREARKGHEPDPVHAALQAELGGADCITAHLREDRRHAQDRDIERLAECVQTKFNLEMGATEEMVSIALRVMPEMVTLVPEGRQEVTTEGGLAVSRDALRLKDVVARLKEGVGLVSAFVDPDEREIDAAAKAGFDVCELHTGAYGAAFSRFAVTVAGTSGGERRGAAGDVRDAALRAATERLRHAAKLVHAAGMRCNAGHALNYQNVGAMAGIDGLWELHIGHAIVARAVFVGLREAVTEMKREMRDARGSGA